MPFFQLLGKSLCRMNRPGSAKPIELAKGKNAVEVDSMEELVSTLELIRDAVNGGELDTHIDQAAGALRAEFKKKK